jgi:hydrogenase maturation protease
MIAVIGCGNLSRGDDAAGPEVLRGLRVRGGCQDARVRLLDAGTDGISVMFAARGCDSLIIIDACRSGSEPGALFEVPGIELEQPHQPAFTLHDFRWEHALHAGRRLYGAAFPLDVTILLIEARSTDFGIGLSPAVAEAVARAVVRVESLVRSRLERTAAQNVAELPQWGRM